MSSERLSGWQTSAHAAFQEIGGYERINFTGPGSTGYGVTLATEGQEDGGAGGPPSPIPLPAPAPLLLAALAGLAGISRRLEGHRAR